jgi:hypothetical protein
MCSWPLNIPTMPAHECAGGHTLSKAAIFDDLIPETMSNPHTEQPETRDERTMSYTEWALLREASLIWFVLTMLFAGGGLAVQTGGWLAPFAEAVLSIDPAEPWGQTTLFMIMTPVPFYLGIKYLRGPVRRGLGLSKAKG